MQLQRILNALGRWWWLGVTPIAIILAYVLVTYRAPTPLYQVILRFTAGGTPAAALSPDYDRYYAWLSSEYVANGLADLAVTGAFAQSVAERLIDEGITVDAGAIQGAIVTDNAQSVMVIYLTWPNAEEASVIASTVGETLIELGPVFYPQMDSLGQIAKIADPPAPFALAPSLRTRLLGPVVRLLIGTALGAGLIAVAAIADPFVREVSDLDSLGICLAGSVPVSANPGNRLPEQAPKRSRRS